METQQSLGLDREGRIELLEFQLEDMESDYNKWQKVREELGLSLDTNKIADDERLLLLEFIDNNFLGIKQDIVDEVRNSIEVVRFGGLPI